MRPGKIIQFSNFSPNSTNCYSVNNLFRTRNHLPTMAFKMNIAYVFAMVFCIQTLHSALAKPSLGGCGCDGFEGGFPSEREFGFGRREFGHGQISPPISFLPVPQPVPIRVPPRERQSVTIPNIILALLPPNQKPPCERRPIIRPSPIVIPVPQPFPLPIGERCGGCS